jgi:hypothetical protein
MWHCNHCGGNFERDDMEIVTVIGTGCCLLCYERLTDTLKPLPAVLRREIEQVVNAPA